MLAGSSARFSRRSRLTDPADFRRVFRDCRYKSSDRWITVLSAPNRIGRPRLGLAISRKAARRAVSRNRIKRLIRESFRNRQSQLAALDVVVVGRSGIDAQSNDVLLRALERHWTRLGQSCERF